MIIHSLYDIDKLLAIRNKPEKKVERGLFLYYCRSFER